MKRRKSLAAIFVALLLLFGSATAVWQMNKAYAKSRSHPAQVNAKAIMAKYSPQKPKNKTTGTSIRKSRLAQMNVVNEAAQVFNVLPITIVEEMKKGKTLTQIAKEKGLAKNQFLKKLAEVENKTVNDAVKAGTITEDHATALKEGQKDRLAKSLTLKSVNVKDHMAMDMGN